MNVGSSTWGLFKVLFQSFSERMQQWASVLSKQGRKIKDSKLKDSMNSQIHSPLSFLMKNGPAYTYIILPSLPILYMVIRGRNHLARYLILDSCGSWEILINMVIN
jgi:hypothetical protein